MITMDAEGCIYGVVYEQTENGWHHEGFTFSWRLKCVSAL